MSGLSREELIEEIKKRAQMPKPSWSYVKLETMTTKSLEAWYARILQEEAERAERRAEVKRR